MTTTTKYPNYFNDDEEAPGLDLESIQQIIPQEYDQHDTNFDITGQHSTFDFNKYTIPIDSPANQQKKQQICKPNVQLVLNSCYIIQVKYKIFKGTIVGQYKDQFQFKTHHGEITINVSDISFAKLLEKPVIEFI